MNEREPPSNTAFLIAGTFDARIASRFIARLAEIPPAVCVTLDFHRARAISDVALAMLATALAASRRQHSFLGLSNHHERVLRYLAIGGDLGARVDA